MTVPPNQPPDPPFASTWKITSTKETEPAKTHAGTHQGRVFLPIDNGEKVAEMFQEKLKEKKQ